MKERLYFYCEALPGSFSLEKIKGFLLGKYFKSLRFITEDLEVVTNHNLKDNHEAEEYLMFNCNSQKLTPPLAIRIGDPDSEDGSWVIGGYAPRARF